MALVGKAALTTVRTASTGYVLVPFGVQVPDDILEDDAKRLVEEGYLEERATDSPDADDKPAKVADVLKDVGDDKTKAAEALEVEKARGESARSTLIEKLEAIVNA